MRVKPMETSVKFCLLTVLLGVVNTAVYWVSIFCGKMPDASVAVAGITEMIAPVIAYYIYQAKLKDSRNKYGIDADGVPFAEKERDEEVTYD